MFGPTGQDANGISSASFAVIQQRPGCTHLEIPVDFMALDQEN